MWRREAENSNHRLEASRGSGLSPYLVRPHGEGSHLFNGQGLLQIGTERSAVVPALALPGLPATKKKGRVLEVGGSWGRIGLAPAEPRRREAPCTQPRRHGQLKVARGVARVWQEEPRGERKGVRGQAPSRPSHPMDGRAELHLSSPGTSAPPCC